MHKAAKLKEFIRKQDFESAQLALIDGANPNTVIDDFSAMHIAAEHGHDEILRHMLKNHQGDPNIANKFGNTPLHQTAFNGHKSTALLLLEYGADAYLLNRDGNTPAQYHKCHGYNDNANAINDYAAKSEPWKMVDDHQILFTEIKPELGYQFKEIFNFATKERRLIARNLNTGQESIDSTAFQDLSHEILARAQAEYISRGGRINPEKPLTIHVPPKPAAKLSQT